MYKVYRRTCNNFTVIKILFFKIWLPFTFNNKENRKLTNGKVKVILCGVRGQRSNLLWSLSSTLSWFIIIYTYNTIICFCSFEDIFSILILGTLNYHHTYNLCFHFISQKIFFLSNIEMSFSCWFVLLHVVWKSNFLILTYQFLFVQVIPTFNVLCVWNKS